MAANKYYLTDATKDRLMRVLKWAESQMNSKSLPTAGKFKAVVAFVGKSDAAIDKGDTGTVILWDGEAGDEVETEFEVEATNLFGDVEADKWVMVIKIGQGWYLVAAECPDA